MIVTQNLKFIQEFTFLSMQCIHSSLAAKLPMHNCPCAKHAKICFCSIQKTFESSINWKISAYDAAHMRAINIDL